MYSNEFIKFNVAEHGYDTYVKRQFFESKIKGGVSVYHKALKFMSDQTALNSTLDNLKDTETKILVENLSEYDILNKDYYASIEVCDDLTYFYIWGDYDVIEEVSNDWAKQFKPYLSAPTLSWYYMNNGRSECENLKLNIDCQPCDEMYPFLKGETLREYYDRYNKSKASILILQGPPGTGKTTFIRGLLSHLNKSAIITYDDNIIKSDNIFTEFITGDIDYIIFEDADAFLSSRNTGNTTMHRFLNIGDGLVSRPNKKLIFTTNLESISDIDSALTREGRCFDILEFDSLSVEQANKFVESQNIDVDLKGEKFTIAEIYNSKKYKKEKPDRKIGFIK